MLQRIVRGVACVVVLAAPAAAQRKSTSRPPADEFSAVRCDGDVVKALAGQRTTDGTASRVEAAHRDINLKDVGGAPITDALFLSGWEMCGHEYQLLEDRRTVRDAIAFPAHSRRQPAFLGTCEVDGKTVADVLAVLDNPAPRATDAPPYASDDTTMLAASAAWRIDHAHARFVPLSVAGLRCPRGGIFTVDGGM